MTAREVALRVVGAVALMAAGGVLVWVGALGLYTQTLFIAFADPPSAFVAIISLILLFCTGAFIGVIGVAMIFQLLGRAAKALL